MLNKEEQGAAQMIGYIYVGLMVLFTIYGQLIIKSQVSAAGEFPSEINEKIMFLIRLLLNPLIISGLAAAFLASMAWMATLTQLELSVAYPFTSLTFVAVMFSSVLIFDEPVSWSKIIGTTLVLLGLVVIAR